MRNMPLIVQAALEKIFKMVDGWTMSGMSVL